MTVGKKYLGKLCEVVWRDPGNGQAKSRVANKSDVAAGWAALATQREYGIVDDITDGVVRILHTIGTDPAGANDPTVDLWCTWVPEAIIEKVTIYIPVMEPAA